MVPHLQRKAKKVLLEPLAKGGRVAARWFMLRENARGR